MLLGTSPMNMKERLSRGKEDSECLLLTGTSNNQDCVLLSEPGSLRTAAVDAHGHDKRRWRSSGQSLCLSKTQESPTGGAMRRHLSTGNVCEKERARDNGWSPHWSVWSNQIWNTLSVIVNDPPSIFCQLVIASSSCSGSLVVLESVPAATGKGAETHLQM